MRKTGALVGVLFLNASFVCAARLNSHAPGFSLRNSQKETRTLADYRGKIILINFWASWCAPCMQELPALNRLAAEYRGKNVRVLAINVDPDRKMAQRTLARLGLSAPHLEVLWDSRSQAVRTYDIQTMPSSFIVDPRGVIRAIHAGYLPSDPAAWRKEINALR